MLVDEFVGNENKIISASSLYEMIFMFFKELIMFLSYVDILGTVRLWKTAVNFLWATVYILTIWQCDIFRGNGNNHKVGGDEECIIRMRFNLWTVHGLNTNIKIIKQLYWNLSNRKPRSLLKLKCKRTHKEEVPICFSSLSDKLASLLNMLLLQLSNCCTWLTNVLQVRYCCGYIGRCRKGWR